MTHQDAISFNGEIIFPTDIGLTLRQLMTGTYVYCDLNVCNRQPLDFYTHLRNAEQTYTLMYGKTIQLTESLLAQHIDELLHFNRYPSSGSIHVELYILPNGSTLIICGDILIDEGYALRGIRPRALLTQYELPFEGHATSFSKSAQTMNDKFAKNEGYHCVLRANHDGVLCGIADATIFAVQKGAIFYSHTIDTGLENIAINRVSHAASKTGLIVKCQPININQLNYFDEFFWFDYRGITSISECNDNLYMCVIAERIINNMD